MARAGGIPQPTQLVLSGRSAVGFAVGPAVTSDWRRSLDRCLAVLKDRASPVSPWGRPPALFRAKRGMAHTQFLVRLEMRVPYHIAFSAVGQTPYHLQRRSRTDLPPPAQLAELRRFLDWATAEYGGAAEMASAFIAWAALHQPKEPLPLIVSVAQPTGAPTYVVQVDRFDVDGRPVVVQGEHFVRLAQGKRRLRDTDEWPHGVPDSDQGDCFGSRH